jgi:hypothetical protein
LTELGVFFVFKDINSIEPRGVMRTICILALIVAVCVCSAVDPEMVFEEDRCESIAPLHVQENIQSNPQRSGDSQKDKSDPIQKKYDDMICSWWGCDLPMNPPRSEEEEREENAAEPEGCDYYYVPTGWSQEYKKVYKSDSIQKKNANDESLKMPESHDYSPTG